MRHTIDPFDEHDMTKAFLKLSLDRAFREELRKKAVVRAKMFSWEKSAEEVLDIYNQVMTLPKFGVCGKKRNKMVIVPKELVWDYSEPPADLSWRLQRK